MEGRGVGLDGIGRGLVIVFGAVVGLFGRGVGAVTLSTTGFAGIGLTALIGLAAIAGLTARVGLSTSTGAMDGVLLVD
ncbi:hypothetical protein CREGCYN_14760 [Synechococcus sp. M16CYN]